MTRFAPAGVPAGAGTWVMVAAAAVLLAAAPAAAHSTAYDSDPVAGARLSARPDAVWVQFTEPLHEEGSHVHVIGADGSRFDAGNRFEHTDLPYIHVDLAEPLPPGAYRLAWQTFSATDGHVITGSIGFAIGDHAPPASGQDNSLDVLHLLGRIATHVGLAMAAVTLWHPVTGPTGPIGARVARNGRVLHLAGIAALLASAATAAGTIGAAFADWISPLRLVLGVLWLTPFAARRAPVWWFVAVALSAQMGHATGDAVGTLLEMIHALAAAAWIGGLIALLLAFRHDPADLAARGRRFGGRAMTLVGVLVATGAMLTALLLGADLFTAGWTRTLWGQAFIVKLVAVTAMTVQAALNRRAVGRVAASDGAWHWRRLVGLERATGIVALVAVSVMLATSPPSGVSAPVDDGVDSIDADPDDGLHVTAKGTVLAAHGWLAPTPRGGDFTAARLQILHGNATVEANTCGRDDCTRIAWWQANDTTTRQQATMAPAGDGWWTAQDLLLPVAGDYQFEIIAQTADVYEDRIVGSFSAA